MNFIKHILALAALALFSFGAQAGGTQTGTILTYTSEQGGAFNFKMSGNNTGGPSCATSNPNYISIDGSTTAGRGQIAVMVSAMSLGETVTIVGSGVCTQYATIETLNYLTVSY